LTRHCQERRQELEELQKCAEGSEEKEEVSGVKGPFEGAGERTHQENDVTGSSKEPREEEDRDETNRYLEELRNFIAAHLCRGKPSKKLDQTGVRYWHDGDVPVDHFLPAKTKLILTHVRALILFYVMVWSKG